MVIEEYIKSIDQFYTLYASDQVDFFAYFLHVSNSAAGFMPRDIQKCFECLRLRPHSSIGTYLTRNTAKTAKQALTSKYIRTKTNYQISRNFEEKISAKIGNNTPKAVANKDIRELLSSLDNEMESDFFEEAVKCFEVQAYRAAIIMTWTLGVDHMQKCILKNKLTEFNDILSQSTDKFIKIRKVNTKDDFSEIPEGKFLDMCRSANIITHDIKKILDAKLGIRNSAAHPSAIKIIETKAIDFIEDIILNIVKKYSI
ncbi:hypothetical protein [Hymenobacter sp. BT190]|uniref:hypothetical protein n=1 Tax=Hymenobacter sp. BT190 TaxID=2763505 RepID=UPI00165113FE|nr:hypothetical protein [Hymenobacter sp. BT190]MBC6697170.1 hypothetical protein [Hymenobacter sp. BT190]